MRGALLARDVGEWLDWCEEAMVRDESVAYTYRSE